MRIFLFILVFFLSACGPKDISTESNEDPPIRTSASTAEQMRYPFFGSDANQKMLYERNTIDNMVVRQHIISSSLHDQSVSPENPTYRATPKEKSPFQQ